MLVMTAMITPVRVCLIDDDHLHYYYIIDLIFDIFFGLDIFNHNPGRDKHPSSINSVSSDDSNITGLNAAY